MLHKSPKKSAKKYSCVKCDYSSNDKKDFTKNLGTTKHKMLHNATSKIRKKYICETCAKHYQHHSSYYRHKKKCKSAVMEAPAVFDQEKEDMKNELKEMRGMMKDLISTTRDLVPKVGNNNISINVFLNEHCKNAMNLTDFVDKIRVSLDDLIKTRRVGYVDGISDIFIKNLEDLSTKERPIHCSDAKRLKFYVKDDDRWEKDGVNKMKAAINTVATKQIRAIKEWETKHPNYLEDDKLMNEWYNMIRTTMGGSTEDIREKNGKEICKNVGANVILKDAIENSNPI
jgi:hypothetical protein